MPLLLSKIVFCLSTLWIPLSLPGSALKCSTSSLTLFKCKVLWIVSVFLIIYSQEGHAAGNDAVPNKQDIYGELGNSVILPCTVPRELTSIEILSWETGRTGIFSTHITTNDGFTSADLAEQFEIVGDRKTQFDLRVISLTAVRLGEFRCNPFGSTVGVITLKQPKLSVQLSADNEAGLVAGTSRVVLTCNATGADPTDVTFAWSQVGDYLDPEQSSPSGQVDNKAFTSTLTLDPLRYTDDAVFTCTVSNGYYKEGTAKPASQTLDVQFPPMQAPDHLGLEKVDNLYVDVGTESQAFKIPYIANPGFLGGASQYEWTKVDSPSLPDGVNGIVDATHIYLNFPAVQESYYGDYKLTMSNSAGSTDLTATFGKPDQKPTPKPVKKEGLGTGVIVGIVVGVLVLVLLVGLGVFWCLRKRRQGAAEHAGDESDAEARKKKKHGQPEEISLANPKALSGGADSPLLSPEPPTSAAAAPGDSAGRPKPKRPPRRSESGHGGPRTPKPQGAATQPGPAANMPVYTGGAADKPVYRGPDDKPVYKRPDDKPVYKGPDDKPVYKGSEDKPIYPGADKPAPASRVYGNVDPPARRPDDYVVQYNRDHRDWEEGTEGLAYADVAVTKPQRPTGQPDPVHGAPETLYTAVQPTLV